MPKQPININFGQGVNTKVDPWQIPIGQFDRLENSVFNKGGMLLKRNGYGSLSSLPSGNYKYLTTLGDNLTAIGESIAAYNPSSESWTTRGSFQPLSLSTLPLIRNSINQTQCDAAISSNGLVCTAYTETNAGVTSYKYAIANAQTGQNIVAPVAIPVGSGTVSGSPRVFVLGNYFVIAFRNVITSTSHLQYIAISTSNPSVVTANQDIASVYIPSSTVSWDGVVFNDRLYLAYNTTSGGQAVKLTYLTIAAASQGQTPVVATSIAGAIATMVSLCVDETLGNPLVYVNYYDLAGSTGYSASFDLSIMAVQAPVEIISSGTVLNITSVAQNGVCFVYYEVSNTYGYDNTIQTNYIALVAVTGASAAGAVIVIRSLGLGSKAFILNGEIYFLGAYQSSFQSSYFLINGSSLASAPRPVAKLAWENGGGYLTTGLPSVTLNGTIAQIAYLYKDLIEPISTVNNTQQTTAGGVYAQTGINLVSFDLDLEAIASVEIANGLQIGAGFGWLYDGYLPVEQNFFFFPENIEVSTNGSTVTPTGTVTTGSNVITAVSSTVRVAVGSTVTGTGIPANQLVTAVTANTITFGPLVSTGTHVAETITVTGSISAAQQYYYQAVYEWTDNQGNVYRSPGSIPVAITTTGSVSTNTINIPTLRLTYKISSPVKIVLYRWSVAQPVYYQVTSITAAVLNSTTTDSVAIYDAFPDASILGNSIIYTTGGVVEDINPPSSNVMTLFDTRAWLVNAEDPNLLWYSKQIIEATPVEWSDLFTFYIAPNAGTVSTTGPIRALAPMDDKLIIFKANAMYYINGTGPDNSGAPNPAYNGPVFITSTVGCSNQNSIVFIPQGLMFQSDKGIWLLGRDGMSTNYIGAPVEKFNSSTVQSAVSIPNSNQVRFTLNTGETLMYDYFYNQWATFTGAPAVSSCIYEGLHSYIDSFGEVFQETPGVYLDGANPVLLSFTTGWINLAAIQGFERFYYFYFVGQYLSPHFLSVDLAYNYVSSSVQNNIIDPFNFSSSATSPFGDQPAPFGSPSNFEQFKIHARQQKCQAFQISVTEIYNPSLGVPAGAGLTLSGLNMLTLVKRGSRPIPAKYTVG